MKRFRSRVFGFFLGLAGPALTIGPGAAEDFSGWSYSADFRLNTTSTGADIAGDVADFPLLIRLDSSSFPFDQVRNDGGDIRFADPSGQTLALEIERWDPVSKRAEIWVKVPTIKARTDTGYIRMHWGNPGATPVSDGKAVFQASLGFAGAWHLNGTSILDATGGSAAGDGNRSALAAAIIAEGRSLQGGNQGITVPDGVSLNMGSAITVSTWIYADSWTGGNRRILQKGNMIGQYSLTQEADSLAWMLSGPVGGGAVVKVPLPTPGAWHHIAATYDGAASRVFVDGAPVASMPASGGILAASDELCIGCRSSQGKPHNSLEGRIDEVVLARVARSADWIKLSYANQRARQVLVLPPTLVVECAAVFDAPTESTVREGDPIALTGTAECASNYQWSVVQGPGIRILDPEVKSLQVLAPRIPRDTSVILRFTARFGENQRSKDVRVYIKEHIPDPVFSLPAMAAWNGRDTLIVRPAIGNLAAVKASRDSVIRLSWTLANVAADTLQQEGNLLLREAAASGVLEIGLCMENGGGTFCRSTSVTVNLPVAIRTPGMHPRVDDPEAPYRDLKGRRFRPIASPGAEGRQPASRSSRRYRWDR